ncbi:MAG: hypothetical protein HC896_04850 [Bacteroidales bacterium]|nr:hypothetical protein [Bacteroidales bacterium]
MQPILITSPQESNQKLCNLLQNKGLRTLPVPLIETVPVAFKPIDIGRYTWLVFTSKNGVAHFLGQLNKAYKELARQNKWQP